jgi:hypothetical protein
MSFGASRIRKGIAHPFVAGFAAYLLSRHFTHRISVNCQVS